MPPPVTSTIIDVNKHPYRIADGRCFASLECAAHTVCKENMRHDESLAPVVDLKSGNEYSYFNCWDLLREMGRL